MTGTVETCCRMLDWDSQFFGFPIARICADVLDQPLAERIDEWCADQGVRLLYFPARSDDAPTVRLAEKYGYSLVDVRVTLERAGASAGAGAEAPATALRPAAAADRAALAAMARVAHRDTRFYYDGHIPADVCDDFYQRWMEASLDGWAEAVLVADAGAAVGGYITCHGKPGQAEGRIGLVGVAEPCRGQGVGRALVLGAVDWFAARGIPRVSVVTQARNIPAQRLYQRCGFVTRGVELYYHKWFSAG